MATVEQNAEAEADKKHLTGARRSAYIGGAFHRAAAWHDRATTPKTGKGAKHLSRRAKRMALADERQGEENRARIREMQTNAGKFRLKALRQRELPGNSGTAPGEPKAAQKAEKAPKVPTLKLRQPLVPIKQAPSNFYLQTTSETDPYWIQEYYGDKQLPRALEMQTEGNLKEAIAVVERKTGKKYSGKRSKAAMKAWILANMDGQPASAPAPQPAAKEQAAAPSGGVKTVDDFTREMAIPEMVIPQGKIQARYDAAQNAVWKIDRELMDLENEGGATAGQREAILKRRASAERALDRAKAEMVKAGLRSADQSSTRSTKEQAAAKKKPLVPLKIVESGEVNIGAALDPYKLREIYGAKQLPDALDEHTTASMKEAVEAVEERTGKKYRGSRRSKEQMRAWVVANM